MLVVNRPYLSKVRVTRFQVDESNSPHSIACEFHTRHSISPSTPVWCITWVSLINNVTRSRVIDTARSRILWNRFEIICKFSVYLFSFSFFFSKSFFEGHCKLLVGSVIPYDGRLLWVSKLGLFCFLASSPVCSRFPRFNSGVTPIDIFDLPQSLSRNWRL